jgi:hypothetical protein
LTAGSPLGAALDWSYQLRRKKERAVLRPFSVSAGDFALEAAVAIAADPDPPEIVDPLANLVSKSLVAVDPRGEVGSVSSPRHHAFTPSKSSRVRVGSKKSPDASFWSRRNLGERVGLGDKEVICRSGWSWPDCGMNYTPAISPSPSSRRSRRVPRSCGAS